MSRPQQTAAPVPAWIAHAWPRPAPMAVAVPALPFTAAGTVIAGQHTTAWVPAWIAQLVAPLPTEMAVAVPAVPSTEAGGVARPSTFSPQHTTAPVPARIA